MTHPAWTPDFVLYRVELGVSSRSAKGRSSFVPAAGFVEGFELWLPEPLPIGGTDHVEVSYGLELNGQFCDFDRVVARFRPGRLT